MVNCNRFLVRPSLWLPGVAAAFAVFACSKLNLENTLPSSVGSVILRGMTFMTSGLAVSAAWDAARLHEVARIMGRRGQLTAQACWVDSRPLLGVDSRGVSPALGIPNYRHGCGDLPAPIDDFTGHDYGDNMVHFGDSSCLGITAYCRVAYGHYYAIYGDVFCLDSSRFQVAAYVWGTIVLLRIILNAQYEYGSCLNLVFNQHCHRWRSTCPICAWYSGHAGHPGDFRRHHGHWCGWVWWFRNDSPIIGKLCRHSTPRHQGIHVLEWHVFLAGAHGETDRG